MSNLDTIKALQEKQAEAAPQGKPQRTASGQGDPEIKGMLAEVDLLALIRADAGEAGRESGERIDFKHCPICGHSNCFSFYPHTNSWTCYGASNTTGYDGGSALEYYKATRANDDAEAVKWLRSETGHPYEPKPKVGHAENDLEIDKAAVITDCKLVEKADWWSNPHLVKNKDGTNKPPSVSALAWWMSHPDMEPFEVRYNTMSGTIHAKNLPWNHDVGDWREWEDSDTSFLIALLEVKSNGLTISKDKALDALTIHSQKNKYDPLCEMLDSLPEWDGNKRVETLLVDFLGAEDTPYTRAVTVHFMHGAVMRAFHPGCKFDEVCVIVGEQGGLKSTFVRKLNMNDDFFTDNLGNIATKEAYENIQGIWIAEIGELESLRKREVETVKSFVSALQDRYRASYGHFSKTRKRRCIFIATTNSTSFLADRTGNRRFLPIRCDRAKATLDLLAPSAEGHIRQAWAEVMHEYHSGGDRLPLKIPEDIAQAAEQAQDTYSVTDPREGIITAWIESRCIVGDRVCIVQLFEEALDMKRSEASRPAGKALVNEISQMLDRLPMLRRMDGKPKHSNEYGQQRCWEYLGDNAE